MARLPITGSDDGTWGDILNAYLSQSLDAGGSLKSNTVGSSQIQDISVTKAKLSSNVQTSLDKADSALQTAPVTSVSSKTGAVTLVKADVGLGNVDNTSDVNKPVSSAQQTALNLKLNSADLDSQTATNINTTGSDTQTALAASYSSVASATDQLELGRLALTTAESQRNNTSTIAARINDAGVFTEPWTSTSAWTGTGTVTSGRVYSAAGLTRTPPTATRWVARTTLHATGSSGKYAYFGVGSSTATGDLVGIGQGSASTTAAVLRGANISSSELVLPRYLPSLTAGDYLCTVAVDETYVSFSIQSIPAGQNVWGARVAKSAFPGAINTLFFSANDTTAGGLNWGPLVVYNELALPPAAFRSVGGTTLFGTGKPLVMYRADPTTGIGHIVSIPGQLDSRAPAPFVLFAHQADTGVASSPWTESRMTNVMSALESAGYIFAASDNGPDITGGGTQDKFGNQSAQDDYAALATWVRQHFNTSSLVLLGPSEGGLTALNLLSKRALGGVTAAALISPATDMIAAEADSAYQSRLRAAYGASDSADFATKVVGYNPMGEPGWKFRGIPLKFYVGSSDTTAPPAVHIAPFQTKVLPYAQEATVVTEPVGHLDASLYQGSDLVTFFDTYTAKSVAGTDTANGGVPAVVSNSLDSKRDKKNQAEVILDPTTDTIEKFTIVSDGSDHNSWPNRREIRMTPADGGTPRLVQYDNEYGERRLIARRYSVLWRAFVREYTTDPAHEMVTPIWEIQSDRNDRTPLHRMFGDGTFMHSSDGTVGGSLSVTGTVTAPNIGEKVVTWPTGSEPSLSGVADGTLWIEYTP